jgi:hypothetical protein
MKTHWRSGGVAPHILNLGNIWNYMVSFMHWLLYPWGRCPHYPLVRRLSGPKSWSEHSGQKNTPQFLLLGIEFLIIKPLAESLY